MNQQNEILPAPEPMAIAVRAFALKDTETNTLPAKRTLTYKPKKPSEWSLVFDTETTIDASQQLRFGSYQVYKHSKLEEAGFFYNPEGMTKDELLLLQDYAELYELCCMTVREFVDDIFYGVGYTYRATIIGFNLPFDISRLAINFAPARGNQRNKIMKGGFTFQLSENPDFPRVQIKHISSRDAFIQFAATRRQRTARADRKKKRYEPIHRGFFIDCKTLAAALTSQSHSLNSLAKRWGVESQKLSTNEHGQTLMFWSSPTGQIYLRPFIVDRRQAAIGAV